MKNSFSSPWTGRWWAHFEILSFIPKSLWPGSDSGRSLSFKTLWFEEAVTSKEEPDKPHGGWLLWKSLGNLIKDCLGLELMTVKPVSTFVSASSFWKLFSWRAFIRISGSTGTDRRYCRMPVSELSAREDRPGLLQKGSLERSDVPLGCGSSRECALNLRLLLLRLRGSKVLGVESEFSLEHCRCMSPLKLPLRKEHSAFLTPSPGFGWTYETRKGRTNETSRALPVLRRAI